MGERVTKSGENSEERCKGREREGWRKRNGEGVEEEKEGCKNN